MSTVLHPNGFIIHDLEDGKRLHIWADDLPVAQTVHTPLHDHTFRFESTIIMGRLVHEDWRCRVGFPDMTPTHTVYAVQGPSLITTDVRVEAKLRIKGVFGPGNVYQFGGPGNYHNTYGIGLTATIMRKIETDMAPYPTVLVPIGMKPDNDFTRTQYPEALLLTWVARVYAILKEREKVLHA